MQPQCTVEGADIATQSSVGTSTRMLSNRPSLSSYSTFPLWLLPTWILSAAARSTASRSALRHSFCEYVVSPRRPISRPKETPAEKISAISGSATTHASLSLPCRAFQLWVILVCSASFPQSSYSVPLPNLLHIDPNFLDLGARAVLLQGTVCQIILRFTCMNQRSAALRVNSGKR